MSLIQKKIKTEKLLEIPLHNIIRNKKIKLLEQMKQKKVVYETCLTMEVAFLRRFLSPTIRRHRTRTSNHRCRQYFRLKKR